MQKDYFINIYAELLKRKKIHYFLDKLRAMIIYKHFLKKILIFLVEKRWLKKLILGIRFKKTFKQNQTNENFRK